MFLSLLPFMNSTRREQLQRTAVAAFNDTGRGIKSGPGGSRPAIEDATERCRRTRQDMFSGKTLRDPYKNDPKIKLKRPEKILLAHSSAM
jgi:hypothetical protein